MGFSLADGAKDKRSSIIDAYIGESESSSEATQPEDEDRVGPLRTSYESKIRRASLALQKTIAEELAVYDDSDSDLGAIGSDSDGVDEDNNGSKSR